MACNRKRIDGEVALYMQLEFRIVIEQRRRMTCFALCDYCHQASRGCAGYPTIGSHDLVISTAVDVAILKELLYR